MMLIRGPGPWEHEQHLAGAETTVTVRSRPLVQRFRQVQMGAAICSSAYTMRTSIPVSA
jgi:hypothetical protein